MKWNRASSFVSLQIRAGRVMVSEVALAVR